MCLIISHFHVFNCVRRISLEKINTRIQTDCDLNSNTNTGTSHHECERRQRFSWWSREKAARLKDSDSNEVVLTRFLMLHHFEKWFRNEYCVRSRRDDALLQYRWQKLRRQTLFHFEEEDALIKIRQRRSHEMVLAEVACSITVQVVRSKSKTQGIEEYQVTSTHHLLDSSIPICISTYVIDTTHEIA